MNLQGKKVIVTGGLNGLGKCMVERLIAKDAIVVIFDIAGGDFQCDVSDYGQVLSVVNEYYDQFGAPDVLINNAGILRSGPLIRIGSFGIERHSMKTWDKVIRTDLSSVFYMTSCVVEKMVMDRVKGVIVNISSVSAGGNPGQSAYSAAKAGVNALTRGWAQELGPYGIRVVGVAPGFCDTLSAKEATSDAAMKNILKRVPLRRLGKPEEIANGVIAVIENEFFNGKTLELDGGLVI